MELNGLVNRKLLIIIPVFILVFYSYTLLNSKINQNNVIDYKHTCNPINKNAQQFSIPINNVEYPKFVPMYYNKSINLKCLNSSNVTKTILLWNTFVGMPFKDHGFGKRELFEKLKCPVTNCELTNDKNKLNESDLILFHVRSHMPEFPKYRLSHHRWVHVVYESSIHCSQCEKYSNMFNLSANYMETSDFTSIYWTDSGLYWDNEKVDSHTSYDRSLNKTKFSFALMSQCNGRYKRLDFINMLKKYMPIEIYGGCGNWCAEPCRENLAKNFKFLLAFENSLCNGYITEKFFDTLRYDIIPVVFGDGNYEYYVPKSGYINVLDYKTPKDLADYLHYLDKNTTAYNEYFKWKKYLKYDSNYPFSGYLCEMCIKLQLESKLGSFEKKQFEPLDNFNITKTCRELSFENEIYNFTSSQPGSWLIYFSDGK